jgi:hypothetical protein
MWHYGGRRANNALLHGAGTGLRRLWPVAT